MSTDTIVYPIGERLYINLTDRCTLACAFCPKHKGTWQLREHDLALHHRPAAREVIDAVGDPGRYQEVVFCGYGEPTLRITELLEVARHIKGLGGRVRVNTDGLANRIHKRNVLPELGTCVDTLSISLNAQNAAVYEHHCKPAFPGAYQAMLDFLQLAPRYVKEVTATAIDGLEDVNVEACARLAASAGAKFRRRVLDVVGQ
ncbi:MAG: radical SAM protein [Pseudomonadota bacterium]|nr:MAG: radical SAM protein [Pseudomonadota bacterium]